MREAPWRGGIFYYSPEDPRLWVPKRYTPGWTLNYARPAAWLFSALLLAVILASLALLPILRRRPG